MLVPKKHTHKSKYGATLIKKIQKIFVSEHSPIIRSANTLHFSNSSSEVIMVKAVLVQFAIPLALYIFSMVHLFQADTPRNIIEIILALLPVILFLCELFKFPRRSALRRLVIFLVISGVVLESRHRNQSLIQTRAAHRAKTFLSKPTLSANSSAVEMPKISQIMTIYSNETRFTDEDRCSHLEEVVWGNEAAEDRAGWTRHWKWAVGIGAATAVAYKMYKNPSAPANIIQEMKAAVMRFSPAENNLPGRLR